MVYGGKKNSYDLVKTQLLFFLRRFRQVFMPRRYYVLFFLLPSVFRNRVLFSLFLFLFIPPFLFCAIFDILYSTPSSFTSPYSPRGEPVTDATDFRLECNHAKSVFSCMMLVDIFSHRKAFGIFTRI